jgi:MFS family permease
MAASPRNYWQTWTASLLFFVAFYTLLVPLPLYLVEIGLPDWQIGLILGAFGVASLIGRPLAGLAADRLGYRPVMVGGALTLIIGVAGVTLTTQPALLFGLRLLQAGGYVAFTTASNALVVALAAPDERKSLLTRFGAAANVAMTITPATINFLLPWLTLNGALWVAGGFALICGGLALRVQSPRSNLPTSTPLLAQVRTRRIVLPLLLAMLVGCGFGTFLQFLPLLAERRGGVSSGLLFALYGAGIALTRFLVARWMDRGDQRLILRLGYGLLTLGLLCFATGQSWLLFAPAALLVASGSGLLTGPLMNLSVEALPAAARGSAVAIYYLGLDLGIGGGAWLLAPVLERYNVGGLFAAAALIAATGVILVQWIAPTEAYASTDAHSAIAGQ